MREGNKRMLLKTLKYFLPLIVVASAVIAGYGWLNTAVSLDYARQEQKSERERNEVLRRIVLALNHGAKRPEIVHLIRQTFGNGHVIKEQEDKILVDGIVLQFDKTQSLSEVHFLGNDRE